MIPSAADALMLPSAALTADEMAAADQMVAAIKEHINTKMERRGCEFTTRELRLNVIAEVNQRIKASGGWNAQWQQLAERSPLDPSKTRPFGFTVVLSPTDEAYQVAAKRSMS